MHEFALQSHGWPLLFASNEMKATDQRICAYSGLAFSVLFAVGLATAGWLPLPSPGLTAQQVATMYRDHTVGIRVGMFLMILGAGFFFAFTAVTSHQLLRVQGSSRAPALLQLIAGTANGVTLLLGPVLFALTAFRTERDPQLLYALNDLGWFVFIVPGSPAVFQTLSTALGVLMDRQPVPVFPRWFGYLSLWAALLFVPTILPMFFKAGPFAWNGIFGFYVGATAFFAWIITLVILLLRAINDEERSSSG